MLIRLWLPYSFMRSLSLHSHRDIYELIPCILTLAKEHPGQAEQINRREEQRSDCTHLLTTKYEVPGTFACG